MAIGLVGIAVWQLASHESPAEQEARLFKVDSLSTQASTVAAQGSALMTCQRAIKKASNDPANAKVPDVALLKDGADYRFLWSASQPVRVRNGLGLEVAVSALCVVDETSGKIKLLTLDSKPLISPNA